jgi:transposase
VAYVHMLRSGARWRDCPAVYGPYTTVYNRFNRWSRQGLWLEIFQALTGQSAIRGLAMIDSTHIKARRKRRAYFQAIGQSRGGRTSKLHAVTDGQGRPRALLLTAGNINDISVARALLQKHLLEDAEMRVRRGQGHLDRQRESPRVRTQLAQQEKRAAICAPLR